MSETDRGQSHANEAIDAVADLEHAAAEAMSRNQRWIENVTQRLGTPLMLAFVVGFVAVWITVNLVTLRANGTTFDPPPFAWLQGILTLSGLLTAILILTTANRVSQIDTQRAKLDLQINLLNERRTAKLLTMLDQIRRDAPGLPTHDDPEVHQLAEPTNTLDVARAIEERSPNP